MIARASVLALLLLTAPVVTEGYLCAIIGGAAGVAAVTLGAPFLGFGAGGIAAGSTAAQMMGFAWSTGHGVGVVSTLQSVGAAGAAAATKILAAYAGYKAGEYYCEENNGPSCKDD